MMELNNLSPAPGQKAAKSALGAVLDQVWVKPVVVVTKGRNLALVAA